jgi:uncharacterized protein YkwD
MFPYAKKQTNAVRRITSVLVIAAMTALLAFLSVPPGHAAAKPHAAPLVTVAELEQYMFGLINKSREGGGLADYTSNDTLATVARDHSNLNLQTDPKNGCPNPHQCPGEPAPCDRISNAGVQWTECAENVGARWAEPTLDYYEGLRVIHQSMMDEGPGGGHYDNIMSSTLTQVGVGVAFDANHIWVTEDFIKP